MFSWKGKEFAETVFVGRVRMLIMRGYAAKEAVEIVIGEIIVETGDDHDIVQKARRAGEEFIGRIKTGLM